MLPSGGKSGREADKGDRGCTGTKSTKRHSISCGSYWVLLYFSSDPLQIYIVDIHLGDEQSEQILENYLS